jgi:hypothetical protein
LRERLGAIEVAGVKRAVVALAWVVGIGALAAGWFLGVPKLSAHVSATAAPGEITIVFRNRPAWVQGDLLALLDLTARENLSPDPLRQEDLVRVREAMINTGWFETVDQVRRVRADLVAIEGAFARPAAVVRDADGDHLVDVRGRLLPRTFAHGTAMAQIVVTGAHFTRPQRPGVEWDGADVSAALRLLRLLDGRPWRDQVASVDVRDFLATGELVLVTDRGARIIWGSPPGEETPLEVTADTKLAYLAKAYEDFGRIDTGHLGELRFRERGYFAE